MINGNRDVDSRKYGMSVKWVISDTVFGLEPARKPVCLPGLASGVAECRHHITGSQSARQDSTSTYKPHQPPLSMHVGSVCGEHKPEVHWYLRQWMPEHSCKHCRFNAYQLLSKSQALPQPQQQLMFSSGLLLRNVHIFWTSFCMQKFHRPHSCSCPQTTDPYGPRSRIYFGTKKEKKSSVSPSFWVI